MDHTAFALQIHHTCFVCDLAKVTAPEVNAILPKQSGDREPENISRWLLESLLAYLVSEVFTCY